MSSLLLPHLSCHPTCFLIFLTISLSPHFLPAIPFVQSSCSVISPIFHLVLSYFQTPILFCHLFYHSSCSIISTVFRLIPSLFQPSILLHRLSYHPLSLSSPINWLISPTHLVHWSLTILRFFRMGRLGTVWHQTSYNKRWSTQDWPPTISRTVKVMGCLRGAQVSPTQCPVRRWQKRWWATWLGFLVLTAQCQPCQYTTPPLATWRDTSLERWLTWSVIHLSWLRVDLYKVGWFIFGYAQDVGCFSLGRHMPHIGWVMCQHIQITQLD